MPMPVALLAALVGVPLVEIALLIRFGGEFGLWPTLLAVVATAALGTLMLRRQGRAALARARAEVAAGRPPVREAFDGVCLLVAGALLLTPGFVTDAAGILLLAPRIRAALGRLAWRLLERHGAFSFPAAAGDGPHGDAGIIDSDAREAAPEARDAARPETPAGAPAPQDRAPPAGPAVD